MSERTLYESGHLYSWWTARASNYNAGTGVFSDRGPRGNHWVQATAGSLPAAVANWHSTGLDARSFDNTDDWIDAQHDAPLGCFSAVILGEMDSSWSAGDNLDKIWLANKIGTGTSQQFRCTGINRKLRIDSQGTSSAQTAAVSLNTPHIFVFVFDPLNQTFGIRLDGGTWQSTAMPVAATPYRDTYEIGARAGDGATRTGFFRSPMVDMLIFSQSLQDARNATLLADAESTLAAFAGITLP